MKRMVKARLVALIVLATACAAPPKPVTPSPPEVTRVDTQVITKDDAASLKELRARAAAALREERWQDAATALETILAATKVAGEPDHPDDLLDLGAAYEGLGQKEKARALYARVAESEAGTRYGRTALLREIAVLDYLEAWPALGEAAGKLLARSDLDDIDRLTGLGARGLGAIEAGDDVAAMKDVQEGLDLVEKNGFGATGRLPNGAAQLRFALAEVRRVRSERLTLTNTPETFLAQMDARCFGMLEAQSAYSDAMRAMEPHWTVMGAYRVGLMYEKLHEELMALPPTAKAKTKDQKDLFFAMMHVRYRVLLEKGLDMMNRTAALEGQTPEIAPWVEKAKAAKVAMEKALADEKDALKALPYDEATIQGALDKLEKKTLAKQAHK